MKLYSCTQTIEKKKGSTQPMLVGFGATQGQPTVHWACAYLLSRADNSGKVTELLVAFGLIATEYLKICVFLICVEDLETLQEKWFCFSFFSLFFKNSD